MNDFEDTNEKLTKTIQDVGQELIDNAEEIVGTKSLLCRMTITIDFNPEFNMFSPTIKINKEYLCKRAIDRLSNEHSN